MAKNPPPGAGRKGAVKGRKQALNPKTKRYVKIHTKTGKFLDNHSKKNTKFKGVRKDK